MCACSSRRLDIIVHILCMIVLRKHPPTARNDTNAAARRIRCSGRGRTAQPSRRRR